MRFTLVALIAAPLCIGFSNALEQPAAPPGSGEAAPSVQEDHVAPEAADEGLNSPNDQELVDEMSTFSRRVPESSLPPQQRPIRHPDLPSCASMNKKYSDSSFKTVEDVFQMADCFAHCHATKDCKFYTYDFANRKCYLKKTGKKISSARDQVSASVDCHLTGSVTASTVCSLMNQTYDDQTVKGPFKVQAFEDCIKSCRETDGCKAYTYSVTNKNCILKSGATMPKEMPNTIAAPIDCETPGAGGVPTCVHSRIAHVGKTLEASAQSSVQACAMRCQDVAGCKCYNFNYKTKTCSLMDRYGNKSYDPDTFSGRGDCLPAGFVNCVQKDIRFTEKPMKTMKTDSIDGCRMFCSTTESCNAYTFTPASRTCKLLAKGERTEKESGSFSAQLSCDIASAAPCVKYKYSLISPTIKEIKNVATMGQCRHECTKVSNCNFYTHNVLLKKCFLKESGENGLSFIGERSASVRCSISGHYPCVQLDTRILHEEHSHDSDSQDDDDDESHDSDDDDEGRRGRAVFNPKKVANATECIDMCRADKTCKYISFSANSSECHRLTQKGKLQVNRHFIASDLSCSIF